MGIPGLWDVIKDQDRSVPIACLAEDHFRQYGRPLRIAVDEADWRFNNLTVQQVYKIRETSNQPAYQGIEKSIFYRICRLLTLNVQLLFVFDGPCRPWKRGRRGGNKVNYEERRLLKELLNRFKIPHHEAPGEAEAECARLQQLGVVDAVFSQDSDTLMFGCSMLIRDDRVARVEGNSDRSKENTRKSGNSVRVVYGRDIEQRYNMNRQGLVLFAMLCGGDYDTTGLAGCGPATALGAIYAGLGISLCHCETRQDCAVWRDKLINYLQAQGSRKIDVPCNFPDLKTLVKYSQPKVSTDDQLLSLAGLRNGWCAPIDELKLLETTSSRFNIWGKLYMKWVGPVLLTRYLVAKSQCSPKEHVHGIRITKSRAKRDAVQPATIPSLTSLTFSPFGLTTLQRKDFEGERSGYWTSSAQDPFEPALSVKTEIPTYLLQRALPPDVLNPPQTPQGTARKRKRPAEVGDVTERATQATDTKRNGNIRLHAGMGTAPIRKHERIRCTPSLATYIDLVSESEEDSCPPTIIPSQTCLESSPFDLENQQEEDPTPCTPPGVQYTQAPVAMQKGTGIVHAGGSGCDRSRENVPGAITLDSFTNEGAWTDTKIKQRPTSFASATSRSGGGIQDVSTVSGIRAARLQFLASREGASKTIPGPVSEPSQAIGSQRPRRLTGHRLPVTDIETIDLT